MNLKLLTQWCQICQNKVEDEKLYWKQGIWDDPLCYLCLGGAVPTFLSLTQEVAGSNHHFDNSTNSLKTFRENSCVEILFYFFLNFWRTHGGFKARVDITCVLSCLHAVPQIHLWWPAWRAIAIPTCVSRSRMLGFEWGISRSEYLPNRGSPVQSTDGLPTAPGSHVLTLIFRKIWLIFFLTKVSWLIKKQLEVRK